MIKPRAEMPVDKHGNIADCVIHGGSTFKRANFGRLYEHYWNATTRDLMHRMRSELGWGMLEIPTEQQLNSLTNEQESYIFGEILDLLNIMAPTQHEIMVRHPDKNKYVKDCLRKGYLDIYTPATDDLIPIEAVDLISKSRFAPLRDTVSFIGFDGEPKTSKDPMIIAPLHLILLEKLGDDWSAVASVKTQQFGLPARLNAIDKFSTPGREAAVRSFGESETRSFNCTVGSMSTNEIMDQTNNPDAHMFGIETILTAEKPSNIDNFVDRVKIPYGNSRSVGVLNHLLECRGIRFKHDEPTTDDKFDI